MADPLMVTTAPKDGAVPAAGAFETYLNGARAALASGQLADARALLDAPANGHWRSRPVVRALDARLLLAEGRATEAEAECRALIALAPGQQTAHLPVLCRALIRQDRLVEAREVFAETIWASPLPPEQRAVLVAELTRSCTEAELRAFNARLEAIRPPQATEQSRMAAAEVRAGRYVEAIARLEALERTASLTAFQKTRFLQALGHLGRTEEALRRVIGWQEDDPDDPTWVLQEAMVLYAARRDDVAVRCALAGLRRWPLHDSLIRQLSLLPATAEDYAQAVGWINAARGAEPPSSTAALGFAAMALHARQTGLAIDALAGIEAGADLLDLLRQYPETFWTDAARVRYDPQMPVQVVRTTGARATVVVFPGIHQKLGNLPIDYADALLSRHLVNVIYLRDRLHAAFLTPAPEIGGSPAGLAAMIRDLGRDLGGVPLIALGLSAGGYAAMLHGPAIGAAGIISYSGQTILHSAQDRPADVVQGGGLAFLARIPLAERDVLPGLAARPDLPVWHVAGAENRTDLQYQQRLAGLPQVHRLIQPGNASHNTLLLAMQSGQFDQLLTQAMERAA